MCVPIVASADEPHCIGCFDTDATQLTCTLATKTTRVLLDVIAGNDDIDSTLLFLVDSALGCSAGAPVPGYSCDLVDGLYEWLSRNQEHIVAGTPIQRTVFSHPMPPLSTPYAAPPTGPAVGLGGGSGVSTPRGKPTATRVMTVADKAAGFRRSVSAQSLSELKQPPSATVTPPPLVLRQHPSPRAGRGTGCHTHSCPFIAHQ